MNLGAKELLFNHHPSLFYNSLICHRQFNLCAYLSSELTTVSKENLYWKPEQPPPSTCSLRNSEPSAISNTLCQYRNANICEQCLLSIWIKLLMASKEWWAQQQNSGTECIAKLCQSDGQHFFPRVFYVPYLVSESLMVEPNSRINFYNPLLPLTKTIPNFVRCLISWIKPVW